MSETSIIDMDYRPFSYWDVPEAVHANIKGQFRKKYIKAATSEEIDQVPELIWDDDVTSALKNFLTAMNPGLRGGEDLPDAREGEVEIARLAYTKTVHCEVTSIRARRTKTGRVRYRVVDEYETHFVSPFVQTKEPLTLARLIELIDGTSGSSFTGLYFGDLEFRVKNDWEKAQDLHGFIEVDSDFYPQLKEYYRRATSEWIKSQMDDASADK